MLTMLNNALVIAGVEFFWQLVAIGMIVIAAVTINNIRENRIGWLNTLLIGRRQLRVKIDQEEEKK